MKCRRKSSRCFWCKEEVSSLVPSFSLSLSLSLSLFSLKLPAERDGEISSDATESLTALRENCCRKSRRAVDADSFSRSHERKKNHPRRIADPQEISIDPDCRLVWQIRYNRDENPLVDNRRYFRRCALPREIEAVDTRGDATRKHPKCFRAKRESTKPAA